MTTQETLEAYGFLSAIADPLARARALQILDAAEQARRAAEAERDQALMAMGQLQLGQVERAEAAERELARERLWAEAWRRLAKTWRGSHQRLLERQRTLFDGAVPLGDLSFAVVARLQRQNKRYAEALFMLVGEEGMCRLGVWDEEGQG